MMKVVLVHGKASWMQEVLKKMEASTRVIPLLHHYPVSTEPEEMWEHGNVMLGFDAGERLIQKLPHDFATKVVWGSRYPHHDATSAWDAMAQLRGANVAEALIARMMGRTRPINSALRLSVRQLRGFPCGTPGALRHSRSPVAGGRVDAAADGIPQASRAAMSVLRLGDADHRTRAVERGTRRRRGAYPLGIVRQSMPVKFQSHRPFCRARFM
jgi:hypothetical protein